jgi:hypothetical protein
VTQRVRGSANKGNDAAAGELGSPKVEEVAADPATYFMAENERLGHANILVSGQTGVARARSSAPCSGFRWPRRGPVSR